MLIAALALMVVTGIIVTNGRRAPGALQRQAHGEFIAFQVEPPTLSMHRAGSGTPAMRPIAYDWPTKPRDAELEPSGRIDWNPVPRSTLPDVTELRFASGGVAPTEVEVTAYDHMPATDSSPSEAIAACKLGTTCAFRAAGPQIRVVLPEDLGLSEYRYIVVSSFFFGEDSRGNLTTATASWGIELT